MMRGRTPGGAQQREKQAGGPLLVLMLAAVLPLAAFAAFSIRQQTLLQQQQTRDQMLGLSRVAAKSVEDFAHHTSALLSMLALHPAVLRQDAAEVVEICTAELKADGDLEDIWAARADGSVYADPRAQPGVAAASIAGEPFFQQAMRSGQLSFQTVLPSPASPEHADLILCRPVLGPAGRPMGTVQVRFNPGAIREFVASAALPRDATITVVDAQGTIVVQTGNPRRWVGRALASEAAAALLGQPEVVWQGVLLEQPTLVSADEVAATPWHVVVAQPAGQAEAPVLTTSWGGAAALAGLLAVALFLSVRVRGLSRQGWEREAFLRTLLEAAPLGIAVVSGPDNRLELANTVFGGIVGRRGADLPGHPLHELLPEPLAAQAAGLVAEAYRAGHTVTVHELLVETGQPPQAGYWDFRYVPLPGNGGAAPAILILATPVTEKVLARQRAEALAAQAEQRAGQLQAVLAAISDCIWIFGAAGATIYVNEGGRQLFGPSFTPEDLQKVTIATWPVAMYRPDGARIPVTDWAGARALRGQATVGHELLYGLAGGGPLRWARASAAPVRDAEGHIAGAVVTAIDITTQKEAQAERERLLAQVESAREELQTVLGRLPDGVMAIDRDQRVTLRNDTVLRYLGHDVLGQSLADLRRDYGFVAAGGLPFPPGQAPAERALQGELTSAVEVVLTLPGNRRLDVLESAAPLYLPDGAPAGRIVGAVVALSDITALKQAQAERERLLAEVQAGRENLRTILARLPDGIVAFDPGLRITLANDAVTRFLGRDLTGETLPELVSAFAVLVGGQPLPEQEWPVVRALRGEEVTGQEMVVGLPNGRRADVLLSAVPLRDAQGRVSSVVLTVTDISAQKQAQAERERLLAEVQSAHERLQITLNQVPDAVLVFDRDLRVTLDNETVRRYYGRGMVGLHLPELVRGFTFLYPDGRLFPTERLPLEQVVAGQAVSGLELAVRFPDGRRLDFLVSGAPLYAPGGELSGAVLAAADITALRKAQAEREHLLAQVEGARRSLRSILDQLPEGVVVLDQDLRVTLTNETVRRYAGHDVAGMRAPDLWREFGFAMANGQPFPPGRTPVERALRGESAIGEQTSFTLPDGRHIDALDSAAPLFGPDGAAREVAMVFTDITPLKELDRAKDQFLSTAAHELRTPLTSLKGHTQMLLRRASLAHWRREDQRSLETMDDQVDRMNELIGRLLDVSRIRLGRLQIHRAPTDIVALAREVAEELQVTTEAHRISVETDLPALVGQWDAAALRQVLTNLIGNSIKYAPGGTIVVRVRREDGWALVSVTDQGPGIPPERQVHLFEAFAPGAAPEYRHPGGLGLGLYISRGIVEAHGGRIWVDSRPGAGATFTFSLPLEEPERRAGP